MQQQPSNPTVPLADELTRIYAHARFFSKVDKNGPTVSHVDGLGPCWAWTASRCRGYGCMRVDGRTIYAHRVSYELHNEPIPNGTCVCHRCDTRLCVNPTHLFLGTKADNMRDRDAKKRHVALPGSSNDFARLSETEVLSIRDQYAMGGVSQRELSERFGVNQSSISDILSRKRWGHI